MPYVIQRSSVKGVWLWGDYESPKRWRDCPDFQNPVKVEIVSP